MTPTEDILALENAFWQTMVTNDVERAVELTDEPCVVAGSQGSATIDHAMFRRMMTNPGWKLHRFEFRNAQVYFPSDDVAIAYYDVHEELTVDGKPLTMEAADTSVWCRKNGRWVCSLHTESLKGDPYGRDRTPITA